jgi:hypothetical protein
MTSHRLDVLANPFGPLPLNGFVFERLDFRPLFPNLPKFCSRLTDALLFRLLVSFSFVWLRAFLKRDSQNRRLFGFQPLPLPGHRVPAVARYDALRYLPSCDSQNRKGRGLSLVRSSCLVYVE